MEPSQQEVFLQQVYAQLCLFEDKVATMLQQQYDRQNQVCGRKAETSSSYIPLISSLIVKLTWHGRALY